MQPRKILVVGGALAGPTAAARARELDDYAQIVLIERGPAVSYAVCGLAFHVSGEVASVAELDRERKVLIEGVHRIEVQTRTEATRLDPLRRVLTVVRQDGLEEELSYDAIIFALGAASPAPTLPGLAGAKNVRSFRNLDDLKALKAQLATGKKRVAVLGGGSIGIEAADGLIRGRAKVTILERADRLLPEFGKPVSTLVQQTLSAKAKVITSAKVVKAHLERGKVVALELEDGRRVETDFVVIAAGLSPRTELLAAAGARLEADGTVSIDDRAQTTLPDVYACGVCVSMPSAVTGRPMWSPQGAAADKTAQVAGANAARGVARISPTLGTHLLRALGLSVGRTGLTPAQARAQFGAAAVEVSTVFSSSHDAYFPGAQTVAVELVWDKRDGRLLGAELAGKAGVDKRLDVAATAIAGHLTVRALAQLDLGYSPPFGSQRDPINVAATVAAMHQAGIAQSVSPEELAPRLGAFQLVDLRERKAFSLATLAGARSVPLDKLRTASAEALDPALATVVFCDTGRLGHLAQRALMQRGFENVFNLAGGLKAWELNGLPLARGKA